MEGNRLSPAKYREQPWISQESIYCYDVFSKELISSWVPRQRLDQRLKLHDFVVPPRRLPRFRGLSRFSCRKSAIIRPTRSRTEHDGDGNAAGIGWVYQQEADEEVTLFPLAL